MLPQDHMLEDNMIYYLEKILLFDRAWTNMPYRARANSALIHSLDGFKLFFSMIWNAVCKVCLLFVAWLPRSQCMRKSGIMAIDSLLLLFFFLFCTLVKDLSLFLMKHGLYWILSFFFSLLNFVFLKAAQTTSHLDQRLSSKWDIKRWSHQYIYIYIYIKASRCITYVQNNLFFN